MALKIAKLNKEPVRLSPETLGIQAFEIGDLERAASHFLSALEKDENNAALYLKLGTVFLLSGQEDKALIAIKRSLELAPFEADAYNAMGVVLFRHEFWGLAEKFFRKALELDPMHATAKNSVIESMKRGRAGDNVPPPEFDSVAALLETREPSLSLCMIARNEEEFIGDCLASVQGVADEIIVVDTGSTDRTVEIAQQYGAKVFHFPWINDFSAARNEALKHATCDWILVLDADEQLDRDSIPHLKQALRNQQNIGYNLIIENFLGKEGESSQTAMLFRLFQNRRNVNFEGIIHEQAMPSAQRTGMPIEPARVRILHRGYLDQYMVERDKVSRNLEILLKQREDRPDDPYVHYHVGQTYKLGGEFDKAEESLKKALQLLKEQGANTNLAYYPSVYHALSDLYYKRGKYAEALAVVEEALMRLRKLPDLLYVKGAILMAMERERDAIPCFEEARLFKGSILMAGNDPQVPTHKSAQALASAHLKLKNLAEAKKWLLTTLEEEPRPTAEPRFNLALLYLRDGQAAKAIEHFREALDLEPENGATWTQLGRAYFSEKAYDQAAEAWERAAELGSDLREVVVLYAEALMRTGAFSQAFEVLEQSHADSEGDRLARLFQGLAALCSGSPQKAREVWEDLANTFDAQFDGRVLGMVLDLLTRGVQPGMPVADLESPRGSDLVLTVLEYLFIAERYADIEALLTALREIKQPRLSLQVARFLALYGLLEEAMAFALAAQAEAPQEGEVYALLGLLAEYSGQQEDARVMYETALRFNPRDVEVRKKLAGLGA